MKTLSLDAFLGSRISVALEEGEELVVVHAREGSRRQRREHVRVHTRTRPRLACPAVGEIFGGNFAAVLIGAGGDFTVVGVTPTEPLGVIEGNADAN